MKKKAKAKSKPVAKKTKSAPKAAPKSTKQKSATKKVPLRLSAKTPPVPKRAPVRKVIGKDSVVRLVLPEPEVVEGTPVTIDLPTVPLTKVEKPKVEAVPARARIGWNALPQYLPPRIRFMMRVAYDECAAAGAWPFSFAKFIHALPQAVCALDFSILILNQDQSESDIAQVCKLTPGEVQAALSRIKGDIEELFSTHCSEIYRKWWGSSASAVALLEPYQVAKVDKDFQLTIAEAVLHSMRRGGAQSCAANT